MFSFLLFHWHYWLFTLLINVIYLSDLYWFNGGEYFTEYPSGVVYPYFHFWKVSSLFGCLLFIYFIYLFTYLFIYLFLLLSQYYFLFKYASKVRAACIIVPYNDGSKAPIRLSARGRSCPAFVRSEMFGLGIAPKEKLSRLFNPVSIQE